MTITQRRHYELIAEVIASLPRTRPHADPLKFATKDYGLDTEGREFVANRFATELRATNPAFNRERFLRACRVEG